MLISNSKKIFLCLALLSSPSFGNDEIEDDLEDDTAILKDEKEMQSPEKAIAVSIGEGHAWQLLGVNFLTKINRKISVDIYSGAGYFSQNGAELRGNDFECRAFFSTLGAEGRYFLSQTFPIYFGLAGGLHIVDGKVSPRATVVEDKTTSGQNFLTSHYSTQALSLSSGVGLSYTFLRNIYVDWNIVSLKHSFTSRINIDDTADDRSLAVRAFIESTKLVGLMNITVGIIF